MSNFEVHDKKRCCPLLNLLIVVSCYGETILGPSAKSSAPNLYFTKAVNIVVPSVGLTASPVKGWCCSSVTSRPHLDCFFY